MIREDTRLLDPTLFVAVESHAPAVFAVEQPAFSHCIGSRTLVLVAETEGCQQEVRRPNKCPNELGHRQPLVSEKHCKYKGCGRIIQAITAWGSQSRNVDDRSEDRVVA